MQYLVVHSVQGLLHAVTSVLSGLCQTSRTVSQWQHYPGPCSAEEHMSHPPPASCLPLLATEGGRAEQYGGGSASGVSADNDNHFQTGHLHNREHYGGCCRRDWCRSHVGPGEVRDTTHLSLLSQLCHHLQGTTLVWPARPSYLNKAVVSRWDGLARQTTLLKMGCSHYTFKGAPLHVPKRHPHGCNGLHPQGVPQTPLGVLQNAPIWV